MCTVNEILQTIRIEPKDKSLVTDGEKVLKDSLL